MRVKWTAETLFLLATLLLAIALSISLWTSGLVMFSLFTAALHGISIYIGVCGTLILGRRKPSKAYGALTYVEDEHGQERPQA